jgi:hypothetical protein
MPNDIRHELISQHDGLRGHLDTARVAADRWAHGEVSRSEICVELGRLADALHEHNLYEERVLRDLVQAMAARGRSSGALLGGDHLNEHREAADALARVSALQDPCEGGRELERFCSRLLAHMTWEEKALLNATLGPEDPLSSFDSDT